MKSFDSFSPDPTLSSELTNEIYKFLGSDLLCLPGRADFKKGRFMVVPIRDHLSMAKHMEHFETRLKDGLKSTACLMILEPENIGRLSQMSCAEITSYVQKTYFESYHEPRYVYEDGTMTYPKSYEVLCPVTNKIICVDDFNMALFMPQCNDDSDPLYDPPHFAPYPMIQITSDMLSFAMFVSDLCKKRNNGKAPYEISSYGRDKLFNQSLKSFQKLAVQTIQDFAKAIDTNIRCPMRILEGGTRYYADHHGVALGEVEKGHFTLSLPNEYGGKLVKQWKDFFAFGRPLNLRSITKQTECKRLDDVPVTNETWT